METELDATVGRQLRAIRQRYTPQRQALVALLARAAQPLTIRQIEATAPLLPKSSIYRNLTVLEQANVVTRIATADEFARYELTEALTSHHHHLVCASCGGVEDFSAPGALEATIAAAAGQATQQHGFRPQGHRFEFIGTCARCAGG